MKRGHAALYFCREIDGKAIITTPVLQYFQSRTLKNVNLAIIIRMLSQAKIY